MLKILIVDDDKNSRDILKLSLEKTYEIDVAVNGIQAIEKIIKNDYNVVVCDLIMDEIEYIARNPTSGKDYSKVRKGYFRSQIKSHFIFYKINRKNDEIEIIRILHQRMDIETRLDK